MFKGKRKRLCVGIGFILTFALWTALLLFVDVREIGPRGSSVAFSTLNGAFHNLTGVNFDLYTVTDWLGLVPIFTVLGFAVLGLIQWVRRRSILRVDRSLLVLGGFYLLVMAVYVLFEYVVINYRPVLIDGVLEASYPSSTTLLVMCVMPSAIMELKGRIKSVVVRYCVFVIVLAFAVFMVAGRILSGVHWITDIIGAALFSTGALFLYSATLKA